VPRERSLGTQWALRYGAATFLLVSSVLYFQYGQMRELVQRDAALLLRLEANELVAHVRDNPNNPEALERYIDTLGAMGYRALQLGFRVLDAQGRVLIERGSTDLFAIPLPQPDAGVCVEDGRITPLDES
jgi:hypothetical protein